MAQEQLVTDATAVAHTGLTAIAGAIHTTFTATEAKVPALTGDVATFAEDYIENHVGGAAGGFLKTALGLAGGAVASIESTVDKSILAGLVVADSRVQGDLAAVAAKLP